MSAHFFSEVWEVLSRPKLQKKFPRLTAKCVDLFMEKVTGMAVLVGDIPPQASQLAIPTICRTWI